MFLLPRKADVPIQSLQRLVDRRPVGFKVYALDLQRLWRTIAARLRTNVPDATYLPLPRATASRASLSAVRRRSVSRLSHSCLPLASASSTFTLPFLKYIRVGTSVSPFCCVLPTSLRISSPCMSSLRVRRGA